MGHIPFPLLDHVLGVRKFEFQVTIFVAARHAARVVEMEMRQDHHVDFFATHPALTQTLLQRVAGLCIDKLGVACRSFWSRNRYR